MKNKNKKAHSALLPGEFYCGKCNEYLKDDRKHKGKVHCISCEKRGIETVKNYVDKPTAKASQSTVEARELRQRMEEMRFNKEVEQVNSNHLDDYL